MRGYRLDLICILAAAAIFAAWGRYLGAGLVDDAYIFLRYADNIAAGAGAAFNPGEPVEGFSSAAWTFLLAGVRLLTPRLESAALLLSAASAFGTSLVVWYGLRRTAGDSPDSWTDRLLAFGLLMLPATVYWGFAGMEHPFFTLVVSGVLVSGLADERRDAISLPTAALLALALLARPEGALLVAWVGVFFTLRHGRLDAHWGRRIALPIIAVTAVFGLLLLCRYAYFGAVVPNTYYAKVIPRTGERFRLGALYLRRCLIAHAPLLLIAVWLTRAAAKRGAAPWPAAAFLAGWFAVWSASLEYVGGDYFGMFRFFLPALPACTLLIGVLWHAVRPHLSSRWSPLFRVLVAAAFTWTVVSSLVIDGESARMAPIATQSWSTAGKWIAHSTPADTLIATNVIGAIGYFSRRRLVDMAGLVDPVVAREGAIFAGAAAGHARYHTDYIFDRAPDLVIYYTSGKIGAPPFTPITQMKMPWHFSLIDFVADPRCAQRYEHISVPMPDGSWIEMQKKKTFPLSVDYLTVDGSMRSPANQR